MGLRNNIWEFCAYVFFCVRNIDLSYLSSMFWNVWSINEFQWGSKQVSQSFIWFLFFCSTGSRVRNYIVFFWGTRVPIGTAILFERNMCNPSRTSMQLSLFVVCMSRMHSCRSATQYAFVSLYTFKRSHRIPQSRSKIDFFFHFSNTSLSLVRQISPKTPCIS